MGKLCLGNGYKWFGLALSTVFLSGCYQIEIKETLNLDGTSQMQLTMDMSQMMGAMEGMAQSLGADLEAAMMDDNSGAAVRNAATILKTARAVGSIDTFDPRVIDLPQVLNDEAGFAFPADQVFYYGFGLNSEPDVSENFFVLTCSLTNGYRADGTSAAMDNLARLDEAEPLNCENLTFARLNTALQSLYYLERFGPETDPTPAESENSEPTFTGCDDPALLAKYEVEALTQEAQTSTRTLDITQTTTCAPGETDGFINIIETHSNDPDNPIIVERRADSCENPAILAFYQLDTFAEPIIETYTLDQERTLSCRETEYDITVNSIVTQSEDALPQTDIYNKTPLSSPVETTDPRPTPETEAAEAAAALTTEALDELSAEDSLEVKTVDYCAEMDQDSKEMPFFFTKCETPSPGVAVFHFEKFDTSGLKINSNGTVTYNWDGTTDPITQDFNQEMREAVESDDQNLPDNLDPAAFGIQFDYVLESPWPILEHSHGALEGENTLRVSLLQLEPGSQLSVTLDTDGATLDLISPQLKMQIDSLIASLKQRLQTSEAPIERQVEYILHLSGKIQRLASFRPDQQVALGYLQTQLMQLAEELQTDQLADLEAEFWQDFDNLSDEAFEAVPPAPTTEIDAESSTEAPASGNNTDDPPTAADPEMEMEMEMEMETEAEVDPQAQNPSNALDPDSVEAPESQEDEQTTDTANQVEAPPSSPDPTDSEDPQPPAFEDDNQEVQDQPVIVE